MSAPAQIDWNKYQAAPSAPAIDFSKYESGKASADKGQPDGAGTRFLDSLGAGLPGYNKDDAFSAVKDAGSGLYHIFTHPLDSANLLYHGTVDPMELTNKDAIERLKKKGIENKINGAIEYAESGVPFLGPALAKAGSQFEEGDVAGGAGTTAAAALPFVAPSAMEGGAAAGSKIWSKVSPAASIEEALGRKLTTAEATTPRPGGATLPALNNTPEEVLNYAKSKGIQLTPGQATESGIAQQLQKAGMTAAKGGKDLALALEKERSTFQGVANDFRNTADPKAEGLSAESGGQAIKQKVGIAREVTHDNASQGYDKINYLMDSPVEGSTISSAWNKIKGDLPMGAEENILAQTPRSMRAVVEDLLSGKPEGFKPTVSETIQLRKFFRDMGDTEGLPDKTQATYQKMQSAASSALDSTAEKAGATEDWKAANAGWKDYQGKYGDPKSPLYKIINQRDPTKVISQLSNAPATDIELLKNETAVKDAKGNIVSDGLDPLRRQVVKDIQNSRYNIGNDDGIGGYSHAYLKTLFPDAQLKELYVQGDLAHRLNYDPNPSGTGSNQAAVSQLTLGNQSKMSVAAKMSLPRNPLSFLPPKATSAVRTTPFAAPQSATAATSPITGGNLATPGDLFRRSTDTAVKSLHDEITLKDFNSKIAKETDPAEKLRLTRQRDDLMTGTP